MSIESRIFARFQPDIEKCLAYGWLEAEDGTYHYTDEFYKHSFRAELFLLPDGTVRGTVIDIDCEEEYLPIRQTNPAGNFAQGILYAYEELLKSIAEACFTELPFASGQANRLSQLIYQKWQIRPEFLWDKPAFRTNGIFRHSDTRKWFGGILAVTWDKISSEMPADKPVDVLLLKAVPENIQEYLMRRGIYPAYHMNKKHWFSIPLDDTLTDEEVLSYISDSYELTVTKRKVRSVKTLKIPEAPPAAWVVPANPSKFDVFAAFANSPLLEWHQRTNVQKGDTVYIYMGKPYSAIMFRCVAEEVDLTNIKDFAVATRTMLLRLVEEYGPDTWKRSRLQELGLNNIRGMRSVPLMLHRTITGLHM